MYQQNGLSPVDEPMSMGSPPNNHRSFLRDDSSFTIPRRNEGYGVHSPIFSRRPIPISGGDTPSFGPSTPLAGQRPFPPDSGYSAGDQRFGNPAMAFLNGTGSQNGSMSNSQGASGSNGDSGVRQTAPSILFGDRQSMKRRSFALGTRMSGAGTPGILRRDDPMASPQTAGKNVHWSPHLVRSRSPNTSRSEVTSNDMTTPSTPFNEALSFSSPMRSGPPLRSLREELEQPPVKQIRSSAEVIPMTNGTGTATGSTTVGTAIDQQDGDYWVTVFGFPSDQLDFVLDLFSKHGNIVNHKKPPQGNWVHIRYSSIVHARQALSRNGKVFGGSLMIGVIPCTDRVRSFTTKPLMITSVRRK
jgi:hypothetical protein